jgi:TolB-like protein/DNA-binding winged helix-turn-helix (wHTH) protein/cytochrome c-type biogenesis protein CcmH/NrfG
MINASSSVQFDGWLLHTDSGELTRDGRVTRLQEQPLHVLLALLERPGEVVSRESLIARLWPTGVIDFETGLNTAVRKLRAALDDDPDAPRYIETIPKRGYRFIARIEEPLAQPHELADPQSSVTVEATGPLPSESRQKPVAVRIAAAAALIFLAIAAGVAVWLSRDHGSDTPGRTAADLPARSVAVLPFEDGGPQQRDAVLGLGVAEAILHQLASLQHVTVIARTSSFALQDDGLDAQEIGRRLNARYLLEGSVQKEADQLRITAQLVDAADGSHVWSIKFDRPVAAIFAVQDEIALKVAEALKVTLDASTQQRLAGQGTQNIDAYLEYLHGRRLVATLRAEDVQGAIAHYRRAIELDPRFSAAYSSLAEALPNTIMFRGSDQADGKWESMVQESRQLLERALELDPNNAEAFEVLASLEEDVDRAELYVRRALELAPNLARAHSQLAEILAWKYATTDPDATDDRLEHLGRAMELDPLEPLYPTKKATVYLYQRTREQERIEPLLRRALSLDPNYFLALLRLGEIRFCCQGKIAEGIRYAEQAFKIDPTSTWVRNFLIHMYLGVDDPQAAETLADADPDSISRNPIYRYRRDWLQATRALYGERSAQAEPDRHPFPVVMQAAADHSYGRAIKYLEETVASGKTGDAVRDLPMYDDCYDLVALGQLYHMSGQEDRARQALETALQLMDTASIEYRRGELWFVLTRVRALALLGRNDEALNWLQQLPSAGMHTHWRELEIDPAVAELRGDPRYQQVMSTMAADAKAQRAQLESLRNAGLVPDRTGQAAVAEMH